MSEESIAAALMLAGCVEERRRSEWVALRRFNQAEIFSANRFPCSSAFPVPVKKAAR